MTTDQKIKSNETMAVEGNNKGRSYYRCDEEEMHARSADDDADHNRCDTRQVKEHSLQMKQNLTQSLKGLSSGDSPIISAISACMQQ